MLGDSVARGIRNCAKSFRRPARRISPPGKKTTISSSRQRRSPPPPGTRFYYETKSADEHDCCDSLQIETSAAGVVPCQGRFYRARVQEPWRIKLVWQFNHLNYQLEVTQESERIEQRKKCIIINYGCSLYQHTSTSTKSSYLNDKIPPSQGVTPT